MERHIHLTAIKDPQTNIVGVVPDIFTKWVNYTPVTDGDTIAHDLLEHGKVETGLARQELKAIGAIFFNRQFGKVYEQDLQEFAHFIALRMNSIPKNLVDGSFEKCPPCMLSHEHLNTFREFLPLLKQSIENSSDIDDDCRTLFIPEWEKVCNWFYFGFANAIHRYHESPFETFSTVREAFDKFYGEHKEFKEGEKFTLVYGEGKAEMRKRP